MTVGSYAPHRHFLNYDIILWMLDAQDVEKLTRLLASQSSVDQIQLDVNELKENDRSTAVILDNIAKRL